MERGLIYFSLMSHQQLWSYWEWSGKGFGVYKVSKIMDLRSRYLITCLVYYTYVYSLIFTWFATLKFNILRNSLQKFK